MKRYTTLFLVLIALAWASCTRPNVAHFTPDPSLVAFDSLLWTQPDSAFVQLQAFAESHEVDGLNNFNGNYFHLLLSELLYKNDYAQTNRDELFHAVDYYDSLVAEGGSRADADLVFLDARAHYIYGVGYYEMDSAVPACREYLRAVELMEGRFSEKELTGIKAQFMALAYTRLTDVFSDQYLHEQAIYYGKQALSYYYRHEAKPWHVSWMHDEIGLQYEMLEQLDSAYLYYQRAQNYLSDTINTNFRDIKTHELRFCYKKGLMAAPDVISRLHTLLEASDSDKEYYARCLTIGSIFISEHLYDSAWPYLIQVFNGNTSVVSKRQSAEWLVQVCKKTGKETESVVYADYLVPFANREENKSTVKTRLTSIHLEHESKMQEIDHKQDMKTTQKTVNHVVWSLLVGIAFVVVLFIRSKKHSEQLQTEKLRISNQLETERQLHSIEQAALGGRLKKSNELLRNVSKQRESDTHAGLSASLKPDVQVDFDAFQNTSVCKLILDVVEEHNFKPQTNCLLYKKYALSKKQINALLSAADTHLGQFTSRIQKRYPALTNDDLKYCCLYLLGLEEADISALMQRAYSTVCERNRKIKRILGTDIELPTALRELFLF